MAIEEDLSEWEIASTKKMVAYGFGYVCVNYLLNQGFARVLYFYEVEMVMPVVLITTAYVIFAIWNMINDPLLGYLTDKPRKWTRKWGLRAPWVVIASGPMLLLYYLIWTPPTGDYVVMFIYFILITCLFDTFFSIYNDHVYGGFTNQFPSEYERRKSFSIATLIMGIFITIMGVMASLIVEYGNPQSFVTTALIMLMFLIIFNFIQFTGIRESKEMKEMFIEKYEAAEDKSLVKVTKTAFSKRNFVISLMGYTISTTAYQLATASNIYMFKDVYGLPFSLTILTSISGAVGFIVAIPFWSNYARKHGFKKTYWVCFILHGLSYIPTLIIRDIISATIFMFIGGLVYSGEVIMLMPVASDTYDEVALEMGRRQDATFVGIRNFFFRIAFLVVGITIPGIHFLTGYVATDALAAQTPLATFGVRIHAGLIPLILYVVMGLIFKKYYKLEGAVKEELVRKLKEAGLFRA